MRKKGFGAIVVLASVAGLAQSGSAGFIPQTIHFDDGTGTVVGDITFLDILVGPPGGGSYFEPGDIPGADDWTLVFQVHVSAGDISELGIGISDGLSPMVSSGRGWIPDNGANLVDIAGISGTLDTPIFSFDPAGGNGGNGNGLLDAGETSDLFFVSYDNLLFDGSMDLNFMITNSVPTFTVTVPLPGPGALMAFGAVGVFGLAGRRRRRA